MPSQARTIRLVTLVRWIAVLTNTALVTSSAILIAASSGETRRARINEMHAVALLAVVDFPASIPAIMVSRLASDAVPYLPPGGCRGCALTLCVGLLGGLQYYWLAGLLGRLLFGREKTVAWTWKCLITTAIIGIPLIGAAGICPWSNHLSRLRHPRNTGPYAAPQVAFDGDSRKLRHSVVVPTLDTALPDGKNVIWCATFQMAWDRLKADVIGEPIRVAKAESVAERLNREPVAPADLPEDSYYATAGRVKDGIIQKIREEMTRRFQKEPFDLEPDGAVLVAYAYLRASVPFTLPYFDNDEEFLFTDSSGAKARVSSFGIRERDKSKYLDVRDQVEVLHVLHHENDSYRVRPPKEFVLDLCRDSKPNQIIVACVPRQATLKATLADLEDKMSRRQLDERERLLGSNSHLLIPNLNWSISHHFSELEGGDKRLLNARFEDLFIATALENIDFRLDRSGVALEAESRGIAACIDPDFRLDRPFLIVVRKRGAQRPFFAMWIDNAELLSKPVQEPKKEP